MNLNYRLLYYFNGLAEYSEYNVIGIFFAKYYVYTILLFLVYLWFSKKDTDYYREVCLNCVWCSGMGILINAVIGYYFRFERPFINSVTRDNINQLIEHSADASFPSDHTTFLLCISLILLNYSKTRKAGITIFTGSLLSGISRIYCGLHYPFDILGSLTVAFSVYLIIKIILSKIIKFNHFIIKMSFSIENFLKLDKIRF